MSLVSDSPNSLVGFDICMSLSEESVNKQLASAWKKWKAENKISENISVRLKKISKNGTVSQSERGIDVLLSPFKVSLSVPNGKSGQIKVSMNVAQGKVYYYDDDNELIEEGINNWSFSFIADLAKNEISLDDLKESDPASFKELKDVLIHSRHNGVATDNAFSIESFFMEFSDADIILKDNKNVVLPETSSEDAACVVRLALKELLEGKMGGRFILGTVLSAQNKRSEATFAMTDFVYHVHAHPNLSTLDYLGIFSGKSLPSNHNVLVSRFYQPWMQPEFLSQNKADGVMIISRPSFFNSYLIPKIAQALEAMTFVDENNMFFFRSMNENFYETSVFPTRTALRTALGWEICLFTEPGTSTIQIRGGVWSAFSVDIYTDFIFHECVGSTRVSGRQGVNGSINLSGNTPVDERGQPEPEKFALGLDVNINFEGIALQEYDVSGLFSITGAVENLFKGVGISGSTALEQCMSQQADTIHFLSGRIMNQLQQLRVELNNHAFIPPGGGVFAFQNPHFSSAGDLYLDATYHS